MAKCAKNQTLIKTKNPIKHRSPNASSLRDPKHRQKVKSDKRDILNARYYLHIDGKNYYVDEAHKAHAYEADDLKS